MLLNIIKLKVDVFCNNKGLTNGDEMEDKNAPKL